MKRVLALCLVACGGEPVAPAPARVVEAPPAPPVVTSEWADATSSHPSDGDCSDPALTRAAEKLQASPDADVESILRMFGSPAVRPRVVTIHGDASKAKVPRTAETRCGQATKDDLTTMVLADFLADLEPLPIRARTGAWLTFQAHLLVPASAAKLVVLGERGIPKSVPTSIERDRVRARFALDRPGGFNVQLVADVAGGPRPVLEARVFADVPPTTAEPTAPGENEPTLDAMVAAVRKDEGLRPLARAARLDALAKAHAEKMAATKKLAHDVGDGDLAERFQAEGYAASTVGENVAHARTLALAHRALYASPSHRSNLLDAKYTQFGFAVVTATDDANDLWVCEVFSSNLR